MDLDKLCEQYPVLYHMAEYGSWPSILRHGLLSTSALLDLFEIVGGERYQIESRRRTKMVVISHPVHGTAVIRDQKPMPESKLVTCLDNLTPKEWYELLNHKVFFWVDSGRLERLLGAKAYRYRRHTVLKLQTRSLVERHSAKVRLCSINSGSTIFPNAPKRGLLTFLPIADFVPNPRKLVEVTVECAVPDVMDHIVAVEEWQGATRLNVIAHERGSG